MLSAVLAVRRGHIRVWSAFALATLSTLLVFVQPTYAAPQPPNPVTGTTRWAVLLCSFADHATSPTVVARPPTSFFEDLFTEKGAGKGGMFDYWKDMSYGSIDLTGSRVFGWFQQTQTVADHQNLGGPNPGGRGQKMQACIDAAQSNKDFADNAAKFFGIVAIWDDAEDTWGGAPDVYSVNGRKYTFGTAAFNSGGWWPAIIAQEMGHGYGLQHSRATDPNPAAEYMDPWDPMSAWTYGNQGQPTFDGKTFGVSGPSLNVGYRDMLGWVQPSKALTIPAGGATQRVKLADVDHPELGLPLMIKVLRGSGLWDTVELKTTNGWN